MLNTYVFFQYVRAFLFTDSMNNKVQRDHILPPLWTSADGNITPH